MSNLLEWNKQALHQSPMFDPLHPVIEQLKEGVFPARHELNALLTAHQPGIKVLSGAQLHFVPQVTGKLPFEAQYEPRCYLTGEVATRADNWHDLFNALVWLTFPKAKAAINARHYQALIKQDAEKKAATTSERGTIRDVNTLLDESGVIVAYSDESLAGLLKGFKWKELFWDRRDDVLKKMGFFIFGHGLYEKALNPYVGITGQGILLQVHASLFSMPKVQQLAHIDDLLTKHLSDQNNFRNTNDLSPVPLLGIPGWAVENEAPEYYDNTAYFRSGRRKIAQNDK